MAGFLSVLFMAALLGVASFGTGILPLSVAFSKSSLAALTTFGSGLLLGAALGVIIPEGVAALASAAHSPPFPSSTMALALVAGFTFMLVVERQLAPHSHAQTHTAVATDIPQPSSVEFDVELGELEQAEGLGQPAGPPPSAGQHRTPLPQVADTGRRAYPLTFGLVIHALADGLALGSAALSGSEDAQHSVGSSQLSLVVFLALLVHKAPTALALTTSLLSTSLPVAECKRHLVIFSASTPVGTLLSYGLLSFFGADVHSQWPGVALLFSGGSFLYVATVLQPSLTQSQSADGVSGRSRMMLTIGGILAPYAIAALLGGEHGHE